MSSDRRIRTQEYVKYGKTMFSVAEETVNGVLVTEFESNGQVVNQSYRKGKDGVKELQEYLGISDVEIKEIGDYRGIEAQSECASCGNTAFKRELDATPPSKMLNVPVIPIFLCAKCGKKHYSLTDSYLRSLVKGNKAMFEDNELKQIDKDTDGSMKEMQEYIIRIFASKKISRMK